MRGYSGVGPKDAARSDDRIQDELHVRLTDADSIDATAVIPVVTDGKVTLNGWVPERWMKHDAEELAQQAVDRKLSVREVEKLVRRTSGESGVKRQPRAARDPAGDADIIAVQNHLEEFLGLPVRIAADTDPRSGAVTIRYRTLDQLDLICQRLTGGGI